MIERLQQVLTRLEQLPPEVQEGPQRSLRCSLNLLKRYPMRRRIEREKRAEALQVHGVI